MDLDGCQDRGKAGRSAVKVERRREGVIQLDDDRLRWRPGSDVDGEIFDLRVGPGLAALMPEPSESQRRTRSAPAICR